ncbi:OB-fold nucleic acid binding domain protein [Aciduliprofundum boonei T469]|nr:OB-fold nucleic acid binding domain protein [Aciduliprofundum boonei T469]
MDINALYLLIEDLMSYERFKDEIKKREKEYDGLLNEEAIAYMIVDELGRNPGNKMKIADLYDGINATIEAKIKRIGSVETRKNGELRVMRVDIYDNTGSCQLVLWNEEIDKIGMQLKPEMKIKIINGYVRENIYGLQVSLGRWGIIVFQ